ncbi:hypothetical protein SSAG_05678 [Streptomyces sp. Mg1]|nr:hypothetical protein SSAG_05678 [Streptomyces sp. Mg1]
MEWSWAGAKAARGGRGLRRWAWRRTSRHEVRDMRKEWKNARRQR